MTTWWQIEETVGNGLYIVHPDIFKTREGCEKAIDKLKSNSGCRPALYERDRWNGPIRVSLPAAP